MTKVVDEAIAKMREGQSAQQAIPEVDQLNRSVDMRIFSKLLKGEVLSPAEAHQAWMEKFAYWRVGKKLHKAVRVGQSAAAEAGAEFDLTRAGSV